ANVTTRHTEHACCLSNAVPRADTPGDDVALVADDPRAVTLVGRLGLDEPEPCCTPHGDSCKVLEATGAGFRPPSSPVVSGCVARSRHGLSHSSTTSCASPADY